MIKELKEGSRILEDQLRMMDDKYIEMRGKLDWTRSHSKQQVQRIQKEANTLRAKWALAGGLDMELAATGSKKGAGKAALMKKLEKAQSTMSNNALNAELGPLKGAHKRKMPQPPASF